MQIRMVLGLSVLTLSTWAPAAPDGATGTPIASEPVNEDRLPASRVDLPGVTVRTDLVYSTLPGFRPLRLDLYTPKASGDAPSALPLLVFVHGGGWTIGHKRATAHYADFPGVLATAARRGFAVASLEYRLSGEAPFPAAAQDIKAAVRFLRAHSKSLGIDPARVGLWGGSAGAHLAAMGAYSCGDAALDPKDKAHADISDCAQAFVGWYGPYDLEVLMKGMAATARQAAAGSAPSTASASDNAEMLGGLAFMQCTPAGCPPGRLAQASPIRYLDRSDPPALLIHGTADTLVPYAQTLAMAEAMRAAGVSVEVLTIEGANHGWAGQTPAATRDASLQALDATLKFFDRQLRGAR